MSSVEGFNVIAYILVQRWDVVPLFMGGFVYVKFIFIYVPLKSEYTEKKRGTN